MNSSQSQVFTIGHSNHSAEAFLTLLQRHRVDEVVDVRSAPYSRYTPCFNHGVLSEALDEAGINYVFLGGELGGRPADRSCYDADGRVRYDLLAKTDLFDDGIRLVTRHADERRVCLMCSEKDPLDCHRTLLVARALVELGLAVEHILADGSLEEHTATMDRLLAAFKLSPHGDMLRSRDETIAEALDRQAKKVAHVGEMPPVAVDAWEDVP